MEERRKSRRFQRKLLITTIYRNESEDLVADDSIYCEDIGAGGLRLVFPRSLPKGKILDLKVYLFPDPIDLTAKGKVVWLNRQEKVKLAAAGSKDKPARQWFGSPYSQSHKPESEFFWLGVQFIDIDSFTRDRIIRWIKKEFSVEEV